MMNVTRKEFITACLRGGVFAGLIALCALLVSREKKVACNMQCKGCSQLSDGVCGLGIK